MRLINSINIINTLNIEATMMRHHFCEIAFFSDRLYLSGDFDSDLLQRKSYKEAESLATEPRKYRSSTWFM